MIKKTTQRRLPARFESYLDTLSDNSKRNALSAFNRFGDRIMSLDAISRYVIDHAHTHASAKALFSRLISIGEVLLHQYQPIEKKKALSRILRTLPQGEGCLPITDSELKHIQDMAHDVDKPNPRPLFQYISGMRVQEMLSITEDDLRNADDGGVIVTLSFTKTGKKQTIHIAAQYAHLAIRVANLNMVNPISYAGYQKQLRTKVGVSSHALRVSHATRAYARGVPLDHIQNKLRHTNPMSTKRYVKAIELSKQSYDSVL